MFMKRLLLMVLPLIACAAIADDVRVNGEIRTVIFKPEVKVIVKTDVGHETVILGPSEAWRGLAHLLDRRDKISIVGHQNPGETDVIADKMWLNGSFFAIPRLPDNRG
jgi:hypothetical protein